MGEPDKNHPEIKLLIKTISDMNNKKLLTIICLVLLTTIYRSYSQNTPQSGDIIITEIMQNPKAVSDTKGEWIELYNTSSTVIDLNNCVLRDDGANSHTIINDGGLLIEPGEYIVLGKNNILSENGNVEIDYEYSGFSLGNSEDEIKLYNEDETVLIDQVIYTGSDPWPDPDGASMELILQYLNHIDNDNGNNWHEATEVYGDGDFGTPGMPNTGQIMSLNQISSISKINIFPNPADNNITIVLPGISGDLAQIRIFTITGITISHSNQRINSEEIQLDINYLKKGLYFLRVSDEKNCWTGKFIKR